MLAAKSGTERVRDPGPLSLLLHYDVDIEGAQAFRKHRMKWASPYVADRFVNYHMKMDRENLVAIATGRHDLDSALRGRLFESMARDLVMKKGEFQCVELLGKDNPSGVYKRGATHTFQFSHQNVHVPSAANHVVDAIALQPDGNVVVVNFTLNKDHGIKSFAFNTFAKKNPYFTMREGDTINYVWIVPPEIYDDFSKQKRLRRGEKKEGDVAEFAFTVRQFVAVVDVGANSLVEKAASQ